MRKSSKSGRAKWTRGFPQTALIIFVGLLASFLVASVTFAGTHRKILPTFVLRVVSFDAGANARMAEQLVSSRNSNSPGSQAEKFAKAALRRDPTQAVAASALGILYGLEGRAEEGERLLGYAETLTRRDLPTQLWFIERRAETGDVALILDHYDAVLRTSPTGQQLLFPVLTRAIDNPTVYRALLSKLESKPPWSRSFLAGLIDSNSDPEHIAGITLAIVDGSDRHDDGSRRRLIYRLTERGEFELAYRVYAELGGAGSAARTLRNGEFEENSAYPPIDWWFAEEADLAGLPRAVPDREGLVLSLYARAAMGGTFARQLLQLAPGGFRISATFGSVPDSPLDRPRVEIRCTEPVRNGDLLTAEIPSSGPAAGREWRAEFHVPPSGCQFQWLTIKGRGALDSRADNPWVDRIAIEPVR
jgi:hypothetical protein